jgi:pyridoxal phosphate enzyme (YggS family)
METGPGGLSENVERVRERIRRAAERAGRDPGSVRLMAVTKTHPLETVRAALAAGLSLFGENRVQEAAAKYDPLVRSPAGERGEAPGFRLELIGHLQRNKARTAVELFAGVQSIDKIATAEVLDRHSAEAGRVTDVLLELNTSGEESKYGFTGEEELRHALPRIVSLAHLRLRGLMTVGPFTADEQRIRAAFRRLADLYRRLSAELPELRLDTLSMGMSGDFETAVEEGATMVRLGTVLFGARVSQ